MPFTRPFPPPIAPAWLSIGRRVLLAIVACTALAATAGDACAQDGERPDRPPGRDRFDADDDDGRRELPFNTDRLFVPRWRLTDGPQVRAAFRSIVEDAAAATVTIRSDGRRRGYGGVVGSDGWILTKATPSGGELTVVLADDTELTGVVVASNRDYDLALVKVDAVDLPTLNLTQASTPRVGSWLASVGTGRDPAAVGVVSVGLREIPQRAGFLGIALPGNNEPVVVEVYRRGGAAEAGVEPNDRIVSVEGRDTPTAEALRRALSAFNPGEEVQFTVERDGKLLELQATLQSDIPGMDVDGRMGFQNNLGGRLSLRRYGFPLALQHDTVLQPNDCGGPVVDLDGRVVGFNIARAGRTESYAIPTVAVRAVLADLMIEGRAALAAARQNETAEVVEVQKPALVASEVAAESSAAAVADGISADRAESAYADEGYRLVWSDEFNADGSPDPTKWTYELGFVRNEELQWYQAENARCEDGLLVIEARREQVDNPQFREGGRGGWQRSREHAEYTSASLLTRGLAQWQYGRFEMRGRIDVRPGMWPAFWTLGEGGWPACGEIDVMEYYGDMILANAAWAGQRGRRRATWDDSRTPLAELGGDDWADQFHVWRLDWDEERIVISVDGRVLNEVDLSRTLNPDGENPFHAPHYVILNLALGGTNGGDPSETKFPARFEVDYVRVYQK